MRRGFCFLGLLLGLWAGGLALPTVHGQYASVRWVQVDETQAALMLDGVQAGTVRFADGIYFPCEGDGFGTPIDCPVEIPAEYQPKAPAIPDWRTGGVLQKKGTPGVRLGGDPAALERIARQAEADATVTIPAFQRMPSITIVSADMARRMKIAADFITHPSLEAFRDHRIKTYNPSDPLLTPFKLSEDKEFQRTGLAILVQPAPDGNNRAPVTSIYSYESAEEVAGKLRTIEVQYDPNETEYSEYTRTDVGLGVGLGVTGVFSLLIGGLWKWLR